MATNTTTPHQTSDLAAMVKAGTDALNDGDLRQALDRFEAVVTAFPGQPEGHNNLGALYTSIGEYEKAEECFDRVLDLLPTNPNVHYNRGLVRSRQEKFAGAREDFLAVLEMTPNDPDALNNLGVAAFMEGLYDEARERLEVALKLRPGYENALLNLVDVVAATGDDLRAVSMCEAFLAEHHSDEVQRRLVDLLVGAARDLLARAGTAAEAVLVAGHDDAVMAELGRIRQAGAAWQMAAAATS